MFKKTTTREVQFIVDNFDELYHRDPLYLGKFEAALANAGALPIKVDVPERAFWVSIENPELTVQALVQLFQSYGFHIHFQEGRTL